MTLVRGTKPVPTAEATATAKAEHFHVTDTVRTQVLHVTSSIKARYGQQGLQQAYCVAGVAVMGGGGVRT